MYVKIIYRCITTSNVEMEKYFHTGYDRYFLVARHNRHLARPVRYQNCSVAETYRCEQLVENRNTKVN